MALFGNDRSVLPSFRTTPELDSSARSPYDDLNRIERNGRHQDRDDRDSRDRNERMDLDRELERRAQRDAERGPERDSARLESAADARSAVTPDKSVTRESSLLVERTHPLIQGLFDKLPQPESEWSLQARQKWLQTAANIFDLMYQPQGNETAELSIRVERSNAS